MSFAFCGRNVSGITMSRQVASGWVVELFEKSTHNKVDVIATIESILARDNWTRVSERDRHYFELYLFFYQGVIPRRHVLDVRQLEFQFMNPKHHRIPP